MAKPCAYHHQGTFTVRECADARVRRRISRLSCSMALFVRIFFQCSSGKSMYVSVSAIPSSSLLAALLSFIVRSFSATKPAFSNAAFFVFLHFFGSADDFAVTVLVDRNSSKDGYVLELAAPAALEIDAIDKDIRILVSWKWTVAPSLDVSIRFLVEVADGTRQNSGSPERFGDILNTAHGNASQVHFDERFLDTAFRC